MLYGHVAPNLVNTDSSNIWYPQVRWLYKSPPHIIWEPHQHGRPHYLLPLCLVDVMVMLDHHMASSDSATCHLEIDSLVIQRGVMLRKHHVIIMPHHNPLHVDMD